MSNADKINEWFSVLDENIQAVLDAVEAVVETGLDAASDWVDTLQETLLEWDARLNTEAAEDIGSEPEDAPVEPVEPVEEEVSNTNRREHVARWYETFNPEAASWVRNPDDHSDEVIRQLEDNIRSWDAEKYDSL